MRVVAEVRGERVRVRRPSRLIWAALALAGLSLACSETTSSDGGTPDPLPPTPFVVSNPVEPSVAPAAGALGNRAASVVVLSSSIYVSLPPGAIPDGVIATILDRATTSSVVTSITGGGFDPVAVQGAAGDTIDVTVRNATVRDTVYQVLVSATARPAVVRTSPPGNKRDVSLNSLIIVVFSEPMDSASLLNAVTLKDGGSSVGGHVVIPSNGGDILQVSFVPDAPLAPLVTYTLGIATGARDRDGDTLSAPVQADFTTSGLPPDVTAPSLTIVAPVSGEIQDFEYPTFRARIVEDREINGILWLLDDASGDPPLENAYLWGDGLGTIQDATYELYQRLRPGTYTISMSATDAAGNTGTSGPVTMQFVAPDDQQGLAVQSFTVVEYQYPSSKGHWYYAPQLVAAAAPGQGNLLIVGFEMLTIPGLNSPFPRAWALELTVSPLVDTPFFREIYSEYELAFDAIDGHRSSGGQASARITYRDGTGHYFAQTIRGPIVPGALPTTYSGGCGRWSTWGILPGDLSFCGFQNQAGRPGAGNLKLTPRP